MTSSTRFIATHIAPSLSRDDEETLAMGIEQPVAGPLADPQPPTRLPVIHSDDKPAINCDMEVRHLELGPERHRVRVSVENTMLKYQLYSRTTGRPVHLPTDLLCRGLNAIGYRRYENQFSKLAIRTGGELRGTISMHKSGKLLITGTANMDVTRYLANTYVPRYILEDLGLPHLEARDEVISNIVVKIETPYTIAPFLMADREEEIVYRPANFSSALLQNAGAPADEPWLVGAIRRSENATARLLGQLQPEAASGGRNVAAMLARRFHEPTIPRHRWAISFFKPNRMLVVGLTSKDDIDVMVRVADTLAYRYRYEHPPNRAIEDALAQRYLQKRRRTRKRARPVTEEPVGETAPKRPRDKQARASE